MQLGKDGIYPIFQFATEERWRTVKKKEVADIPYTYRLIAITHMANTLYSASRLSKTITSIQDILRKDPGVDGDAQRLAQFAWMLFYKVYDSVSGGELPKHLRWSTLMNSDSRRDCRESVVNYVNERLIPELRKINSKDKRFTLISEVFKDIQNSITSDSILIEMAKRIEQEIPLDTEEERSLLADIYEQMLSNLQSAGNAGEYYTPLPLARFITKLVNPKQNEKILDFACGTGGFLVSALMHMVEKDENLLQKNQLNKLHIYGVEKKPLPHLLAITNLILHGIKSPSTIVRGNLLEKSVDSFNSTNQVDVILTNPPFGGLEEEKVYPNFPSGYKSRDTADLFVYLMIQLLKKNGRAGIILPDGFLFASGVRSRLRKLLLSECSIDALIRLPRGVFNPYTTIATNVLIITKGKVSKTIRCYQVEPPDGKNVFSKTTSLTKELLDPVAQWFFKNTKDKNAWTVSIENIARKDYNLDQKLPTQSSFTVSEVKEIEKTYFSKNKEKEELLSQIMSELESGLDKRINTTLKTGLNIITSCEKGINELLQVVYELNVAGKVNISRNNGKREVVKIPTQEAQLPGLSKQDNRIEDDEDYKRWRSAIPKHWAVVRLSDIAEIVGGSTPDSGDETCFSPEGGIPWLTPADLYDLDGKYISKGKRNLSNKGFESCSVKMLPKGSVLFSSRAPIGYVAIANNPICTNQGFKSLIPSPFVQSEYLYYFLCAEKRRLEASASGTVFKEIPGRNMKAIWMPLPPLSEQNKIIKKLNEVVPKITELRRLFLESEILKEKFSTALSGAAITSLFQQS